MTPMPITANRILFIIAFQLAAREAAIVSIRQCEKRREKGSGNFQIFANGQSLARRLWQLVLWCDRKVFRRFNVSRADEGRPGHAGFGRVLRSLSGHGRNANEVMAAWALNFPPGELLVALQVLLAFRAGKFELAHNVGERIVNQTPAARNHGNSHHASLDSCSRIEIENKVFPGDSG